MTSYTAEDGNEHSYYYYYYFSYDRRAITEWKF